VLHQRKKLKAVVSECHVREVVMNATSKFSDDHPLVIGRLTQGVANADA